MPNYQFTCDWFAWAPNVWQALLPKLPARKMFLEIGSFEGRSMTWTVEHMMEDGGEIVCVDTWEGGEDNGKDDMPAVEKRFDHNMREVANSWPTRYVTKIKSRSTTYLADALLALVRPALLQRRYFDLIYIDGSHVAKDVLTDACMAWPLLKSQGIMVFDDYTWGNQRDILHRPKLAIDSFTNIFAEDLEVVHSGRQFIVRKN